MEANKKESRFWTYLGSLLHFEAPLWNWRQRLGSDLDFECFRDVYLLPTGKAGALVICPKRCDYSCGFRKVRERDDGSMKAVCHKNKKESFPIAANEVLIHGVNYGVLLPMIAQTLGVQPLIAPFQTWEEAWKMGTLRISNHVLPVFFTLRNWDHKIIDLVLNLNRMENRPYLLLVTSSEVISPTSLKALEDCGSTFVPVNEVLDLNQDAELVLTHPLDPYIEIFQAESPHVEPENIFRRCGDAWGIRFQGGEKFMLTSGNTGASYLHFMLKRLNVATPVTEIMRCVSGESEDYVSSDRIDMDELGDGFSFSDAPITESDNIADEVAIRQYREEISQLSAELEAAQASGDNITVEQLEDDLARLTAAIYEAVAPGGQRKKLADQMNNILTAFRNAVNFSIAKISVSDQKLAIHLMRHIRYGREPGYFSSDCIDWDL